MDIKLEDLESALASENVPVDHDVLAKVFRKLTNPGGCEWCGQHVKVGVYMTPTGKISDKGEGPNRTFVTACCKHEI